MELSPVCQNLLIALYHKHRDPKHPATRAYGIPGWLLAIHADMISYEDYVKTKQIIPGPSPMRSELIAAFKELENRDLVRRVALDERDHPLRITEAYLAGQVENFDPILFRRSLDYLSTFSNSRPQE